MGIIIIIIIQLETITIETHKCKGGKESESFGCRRITGRMICYAKVRR